MAMKWLIFYRKELIVHYFRHEYSVCNRADTLWLATEKPSAAGHFFLYAGQMEKVS